MKLGIRSRLFFVSVALIAVALVASELYLTRALEAQLIDTVRGDLLVRARLIAQRLASADPPLADRAQADRLADELGAAAGARVTVVRIDGTVAGDSEVDLSGLARLENHAARPEVAAALGSSEGTTVRYSATIHERLMYVAVPVVADGRTVGAARVAVALSHIDDAVWNLHKTLAAGALFALAIAAIVSWLAAELVSRKLREVTLAARSMAEGDLTRRTRIAGRDEVAALGGALDRLAENLSRSLDELRAERDLLEDILSSMAEGVLVIGADRRIVLMNPALKAMLLTAGDPIGKYPLHVVRNADLNDLLERAAAGEPADMELELAGLRPRRALVRAAPLHGKPGGAIAVFVDVTELRRLESVRRDFVANASHELRSPLTSVRAAAETLHAVKDDSEAATRFVELIVRNAERLENLIDDMLELSRIESRELDLHLESVDLDGVVQRVVSQHAHRAETKHITLSHESPSAPPVRADRRALEHVLGNLVDNAVKYCPEGAQVRVGSMPENGHVRVAVRDNGPGIPAEHVPRLFERFYRVDPGRSRELGGTGLGLAIVKHLVEAMGGAVAVESRPGEGSTFSFTLQTAS